MSNRERTRRRETKFVRLDPGLCTACWKCLDACPEQVLGRIDLGFHRHARIRYAQACKGCKKCVRVCEPGALTYTYVPRQPAAKSDTLEASPSVPLDRDAGCGPDAVRLIGKAKIIGKRRYE